MTLYLGGGGGAFRPHFRPHTVLQYESRFSCLISFELHDSWDSIDLKPFQNTITTAFDIQLKKFKYTTRPAWSYTLTEVCCVILPWKTCSDSLIKTRNPTLFKCQQTNSSNIWTVPPFISISISAYLATLGSVFQWIIPRLINQTWEGPKKRIQYIWKVRLIIDFLTVFVMHSWYCVSVYVLL